ncbi:MAG TPA: GGDEF domain-containing protein [Stellaceae bacterium]|nr:GGDEF domain-containing protein [Stellaceae bacterium]
MDQPDIEAIQKSAARAIAQMEALHVPPTPENFTVWFTYATNSNLSLKRSINILMSNRQDFSPDISLDLYERFFGVDRQAETLRRISQRIESAVASAMNMLSNAGQEARAYGEHLDQTAANLDDTGNEEIDRIREIVRRVLVETQEMIDRSDVLEKQLSKSTEEIGELRKQVESAAREAMTDALTGIGNRKLFDGQLKQHMQEMMESGDDSELCLLLLDIDFFKRFNDTYGHQFGDMVLQLVAKSLQEGVREEDVPARYGGEEFAILVPKSNFDHAISLAERLRKAIAGKSVVKRDTKENLGNITLSIGVSSYRLGEPPHAFISRADCALYKAKQTGRNRVLTERDLTETDTESSAISPTIDASITG